MTISLRDELFDIGGRRIHLAIAGEGSPTVVLEAGMGDSLNTWASIQPSLAEMTCVMSYDRAGLGGSDPAPVPRTLEDIVRDLETLLSGAAFTGPYLLVGHSFGGQITRLFAARHPCSTHGMVLIDPSHEDKYVRFEAVLNQRLIQRQDAFLSDPSRNTEHIDLPKSRLQLNAGKKDLKAPLIVVSRSKPDEPSLIWPTQALREIETELQRELLNTPGYGLRRYIIAERSGHYIHHDESELVISAIEEVIEASRIRRLTADDSR